MDKSTTTFNTLNKISDELKTVDVFPSLLWLWIWDVIKDYYDNNQWDDVHQDQYQDECIAEGMSLEQIWDKLYSQSDSLGWSMEYGVDQLDEEIMDWMRDQGIIVSLDEDLWLDDPEADVVESQKEEV